MGTFHFTPLYDLTLDQPNPRKGTRGQPDLLTWQLQTLADFQGLLVTANGVNNATLTLHDPTGYITETIAPQAMNVVRLRLVNRSGTWSTAWTGFVDEAHEVHDPAQGRMAVLDCTGPYKLWEVTRQSAGDVQALAIASMRNMAGSEVLRYSARAVGYDPRNLSIDPVADSGTGLFGSVPASAFTDPQQQTWSAPIQALLASSGLEFFFDAGGFGHYRRVGFLSTPNPLRRLSLDELLHADLARGDQGLVTSVEVRWGPIPMTQSAARSSRNTSGMVAQLGTRTLIVYAPWILPGGSGLVPAAAHYLADTLLDQYAAGAATGSVTLVADPSIGVGTVIEVPGLRPNQGATRYYVTSVAYQLTWLDQWVMTLGLAYGRTPGGDFPYLGGVAYPVLRAPASELPHLVPLLAFDPSNPKRITSPLTVQAQPALTATQASSSALPVGSVIELRTGPKGGPWVGPSHQYTVVAAPQGQDPGVIGLQSGNGTAYCTVVLYGEGDAGGSDATISSPGTQAQATASNGQQVTDVTPGFSGAPTTYAQRALKAALAQNGHPYKPYDAGPTHFDCSGLVAFAYASVGFTNLQTPTNWNGDGEYGDMGANGGPDGEYYYFLAHGAREIAVADAQPGDLIFCWDASYAPQRGFSHVAFLLRSGVSFGGNSYALGVSAITIAGFTSDAGAPFTKALDMSAAKP